MNRWSKIRLAGWGGLTLALTLLMTALAPQQIPVSLYKINLVMIAGLLGYWLDRALFPYARPDAWAQSARTDVFAACLLRRALVVAAAMIAVGLGA
jgi:hypothetical protein